LNTFIKAFASVLIPGGTINIIVRASRFVASKVASNPAMKKWSPTAMGILSIPVIVKPIDNFVDFALDNTTRLWMKSHGR
jgi:fission process protein 1